MTAEQRLKRSGYNLDKGYGPLQKKQEKLKKYLLKRCDTPYEANLVYRAVMRIFGK